MQLNNLKLSLYANRTELKAEFTLPNTDENYEKFVEQKIIWDKKSMFNDGRIQLENNDQFHTDLKEEISGYFNMGNLENWED